MTQDQLTHNWIQAHESPESVDVSEYRVWLLSLDEPPTVALWEWRSQR